MSILIFALIVLIVAALFVYAARVIGLPAPFGMLVEVLIVVVAALVILDRAGLLT